MLIPRSISRTWIVAAFLTCAIVATATYAWAQTRKAGLWEMTTNFTFQQSPFPAGMGPGGRGPHTSQVCVTQEQIDKYGSAPPQKRDGCELSNYTKTADGYTADMVCTGRMAAKGTVTSNFTEDGHGKTKIHMIGSMQMGPNAAPIEYTIESDSVFKGADCGGVKPIEDSAK